MDATRPPLVRLAVGGAALAVLGMALLGTWLRPGPDPAASSDPAGQRRPAAAAPPAADASGPDRAGWAAWDVDAAGAPLRWDPCSPIRFVWRPEGAPPGAEDDLRAALERLAAASGLDLHLEGTTDEAPSRARPLVVRSSDGWRWAPVLVAWAAPGADGPPLGPHDRGVAEPVAVRSGDRHALVTGQVVLNTRRTDLRAGFGDRADSWGATLLHELAHVLGLAHVDDPAQLMAAAPGEGPVVLGAGDRAGLTALGAAAGCLTTPAPTPGLAVTRGEG